MIQEVSIKNFKSVQDLTLPLSRFNVFIGSNGSGKSNILEAIAFGAAAAANKLDNEFLGSRGIRTSEARLMKSAFKKQAFLNDIELTFITSELDVLLKIEEEEKPFLRWVKKEPDSLSKALSDLAQSIRNKEHKAIDDSKLLHAKFKEIMHDVIVDKSDKFDDFLSALYWSIIEGEDVSDFIIYSPEITALRKFEEESQIKPLGIKGEGLFHVLQIFNESYGEETLNELKELLHIIEWFDDFEAINDQVSGRKSLVVKDRYIPDVSLNQSNVNEGFLFLLFYVSLIISKETPAFFAIDNIEASFHPRLCEELTRQLVELCKKHNKQVIITTHNPAVLDGLNLDDPEQALFVIRRNADGETIADKIDQQPKNVRLSEAWERGYIGGQPETIA
ncbi:AAA family ATPase [Pseudoflavitalea sp. X16]|uniref:AAA family ATPase n=1 Tax=Paraflavitalea devenefica TaxID=2716334 RepID=UPI0014227A9C|nr:AAA family ATPase [Paraflavitalea devenefica]NII29491.1 AAA family ATPase [Paraflavitalea devenefica]